MRPLYGQCTKKGAGNDKQGKDAGNRTLCPYRNFSQAIIGNTDPMFFIQPELARAVWKTKRLYFQVRHQHTVSKWFII